MSQNGNGTQTARNNEDKLVRAARFVVQVVHSRGFEKRSVSGSKIFYSLGLSSKQL